MYLTYEEYSNMGGTVDETAFTRLEFKARQEIDFHTFNRIAYGIANNMFNYDVLNTIKECIYSLIENIETYTNGGKGGVITSVSNDGVGESYRTMSTYELKSHLESIIVNYLSNVYLENLPVLYRGADELPKVVERNIDSI